jgi:hypothetical protein
MNGNSHKKDLKHLKGHKKGIKKDLGKRTDHYFDEVNQQWGLSFSSFK